MRPASAHGAAKRLACILLAAGRGKRMGSDRLPKVCFPVVGVPAINRSIAAFRACGVETIVVVVGEDAQPVMDTAAAEFPGVIFARQNEPLGTGDAVRSGFEPLRRMGFDGLVFCSMGDKVVQPEAVRAVLDGFLRTPAQGALAVSRFPNTDDRGRVLVGPSGGAEAIIEERVLRAAEIARDMARRCAGAKHSLDAASLRAICLKRLGTATACERFLGRTWRLLSAKETVDAARLRRSLPPNPGQVRVGRKSLGAAWLRRHSTRANEALYLLSSVALERGLNRLQKGSHGEVYFTDIVSILTQPPDGAPVAPVVPVDMRDPDWVLGFNSPDQLLDVEEKVRRRTQKVQRIAQPQARLDRDLFKPARTWLKLVEEFPPSTRKAFAAIYGEDSSVLMERRRAMARLLKLFGRHFGEDRRVVVGRAPASVNLMGRHVDVVGGFINVANVDREALIVAAPREDDLVRLVDGDNGGTRRKEFAIGREIASIGWDDWLNYISSARVREMISQARGDWSHIVRAAAVRLQQHFKSRRLRGMDLVAQANIPLAAGLGASSAMLVAASDVFVALNALKVTPHQFVLLCGEGEWYLGSRGTAASHAGMKLGRRGCVTHLRFFPLEVEGLTPFPPGYRLALVRTRRASVPRDGTEIRARALLAMQVGLLIVQDRHPNLARLMEHVRDLTPRRLEVGPQDLYGMLLGVPLRAARTQVMHLLSAEGRRRLDEMAWEPPDQALEIRDALLFGMAECGRSEAMLRLIERSETEEIAALLRASHDAERTCGPDGAPFHWSATDALLQQHMRDAQSAEPMRSRASRIERLPGRFGPASADIDRLVDTAQSVPGVLGAQLSGAGAGGCAMVILREEAVGALKKAVSRRGMSCEVDLCSFVEGAGVLKV